MLAKDDVTYQQDQENIAKANAELGEMEELASGQGTFDMAKAAARDWAVGKDIRELAVKFKEVKALKEAQEEDLKETNAWLDILRFESLPNKVEEMGLESPVKLEGIGRVSISADVRVAVVSGMKGDLLEWLRKNKMGDLIKEDVNPSTLKSFVKGRIKAGKDYPDDLLTVTPVDTANVLK